MVSAYLLIAITAAFAAALTLYSGFGLGTLLLPVFALFFPVETAVAATAVVHGANNLFKVALTGRYAHARTVIRFGIPALSAALAGALVLGLFASREPLLNYQWLGRSATITPVKLVLGALMLAFALFELLPRLRTFRFRDEHLVLGGLLSGFFGGLSGHQGALRSAFLVKSGLDTKEFVGTSALIGLAVDLVRISAYGALFFVAGKSLALGPSTWPLVASGCVAAFCGVWLGKRFLHQVTIGTVQVLTGVLLLLIALVLGAGLI
jgi:uncharacterized membrane protein YfcA